MAQSNEDQIRTRAHELWEQAGKPQGREQDFWLEAERELGQGATLNTEEKKATFTE
jgi:Protein of unknown function (DUF2934)